MCLCHRRFCLYTFRRTKLFFYKNVCCYPLNSLAASHWKRLQLGASLWELPFHFTVKVITDLNIGILVCAHQESSNFKGWFLRFFFFPELCWFHNFVLQNLVVQFIFFKLLISFYFSRDFVWFLVDFVCLVFSLLILLLFSKYIQDEIFFHGIWHLITR